MKFVVSSAEVIGEGTNQQERVTLDLKPEGAFTSGTLQLHVNDPALFGQMPKGAEVDLVPPVAPA